MPCHCVSVHWGINSDNSSIIYWSNFGMCLNEHLRSNPQSIAVVPWFRFVPWRLLNLQRFCILMFENASLPSAVPRMTTYLGSRWWRCWTGTSSSSISSILLIVGITLLISVISLLIIGMALLIIIKSSSSSKMFLTMWKHYPYVASYSYYPLDENSLYAQDVFELCCCCPNRAFCPTLYHPHSDSLLPSNVGIISGFFSWTLSICSSIFCECSCNSCLDGISLINFVNKAQIWLMHSTWIARCFNYLSFRSVVPFMARCSTAMSVILLPIIVNSTCVHWNNRNASITMWLSWHGRTCIPVWTASNTPFCDNIWDPAAGTSELMFCLSVRRWVSRISIVAQSESYSATNFTNSSFNASITCTTCWACPTNRFCIKSRLLIAYY